MLPMQTFGDIFGIPLIGDRESVLPYEITTRSVVGLIKNDSGDYFFSTTSSDGDWFSPIELKRLATVSRLHDLKKQVAEINDRME